MSENSRIKKMRNWFVPKDLPIAGTLNPPPYSPARAAVAAALLLALLLPGGCDLLDKEGPGRILEFDFRDSEPSWEAFFTGYNVGWEEKMELRHGYRGLPEPLDTGDRGLFVSALNQSDNVKMLLRKQVGGLEPNSTYEVGFRVRFATDVPSGCAGVGGAPGEGVKVIADASAERPEPILDRPEDDYYLLNIQYRNESTEWYQGAIMGDIANSRSCGEGYEYEIKELISEMGHATVRTDDQGRAWLLIGTRSGFEGRTELYYTYVEARFSK